MRKFILKYFLSFIAAFVLLTTPVMAETVESLGQATGYVNDYANVLDSSDESTDWPLSSAITL